MTDNEHMIKQKFHEHIYDGVMKHIYLITVLSFLFIGYYMYSDLFIRNSMHAFYFRLLPFITGIPLIIFHFITKKKFRYLKVIAYHIFLTSGVVMMYSICLIHMHSEALAPSVTGAILVIFVFSLEVKTNFKVTAIVFFLPTLAFIISQIFFFQPDREEFTIMADIYPIVVIGFIINRIQYKLRYKLFKSGYLLDKEKKKTEELYEETLLINQDLQQKANEIKTHKEEIEEKNEKLKENNNTKDKFLTIIAHDLINPFNALIGFSDLLIESFNIEDIAEQKIYARHLHQNIHKTYKLLENLLLWARSQQDAMEFRPVSVNLYLLAEECIGVLQESARKKSIEILNQFDKNLIVEADRNMLSTIMRNLISNGIKFTSDGGRIVLKAGGISQEDKGNFIEVSVQDTGRGISAEMQSNLFDLSKNFSTTGTRNEQGTGFGLVLSREFIERHGGRIWVESEPGYGSNFIFTLPLFG